MVKKSDIKINIAKDWSMTVGGRFKADGPFSGEEFLDTLLLPKFNEAVTNNSKLIIDLDGTFGYPTSFIEEAFGGLTRKTNPEIVLKHLIIISRDEPSKVSEIRKLIEKAANN